MSREDWQREFTAAFERKRLIQAILQKYRSHISDQEMRALRTRLLQSKWELACFRKELDK